MNLISRYLSKRRESELIDYVEQEAKIAERFVIECIDELIRQSNTLLSILLSGAGGALALSVSFARNSLTGDLSYAIFVVSAYLCLLSAVIVVRCLWSNDIYPPAHEPKYLFQTEFTANQIRASDLKTRQEAIDKNTERLLSMAAWLNYARIGAVLTPVLFVVSLFIF